MQRAREDIASAFAEVDRPRRAQPRFQQAPLRALVMPQTTESQQQGPSQLPGDQLILPEGKTRALLKIYLN